MFSFSTKLANLGVSFPTFSQPIGIEIPTFDLASPPDVDVAPVALDRGVRLQGSFESETLTGTEQSDSINGNGGEDVILGLGGNDFLSANASGDVVTDANGDPLLDADGAVVRNIAGDSVIEGGDGNDVITGGDANDRLIGGDGGDVLTGNGGSDTFVFVSGDSGSGTINDFTQGEDVIELVGFDGLSVADVLAAAEPRVVDAAGEGPISLSFDQLVGLDPNAPTAFADSTQIVLGDQTIIIQNVAPGDLGADDFILI